VTDKKAIAEIITQALLCTLEAIIRRLSRFFFFPSQCLALDHHTFSLSTHQWFSFFLFSHALLSQCHAGEEPKDEQKFHRKTCGGGENILEEQKLVSLTALHSRVGRDRERLSSVFWWVYILRSEPVLYLFWSVRTGVGMTGRQISDWW
jgi:hypothetical protein